MLALLKKEIGNEVSDDKHCSATSTGLHSSYHLSPAIMSKCLLHNSKVDRQRSLSYLRFFCRFVLFWLSLCSLLLWLIGCAISGRRLTGLACLNLEPTLLQARWPRCKIWGLLHVRRVFTPSSEHPGQALTAALQQTNSHDLEEKVVRFRSGLLETVSKCCDRTVQTSRKAACTTQTFLNNALRLQTPHQTPRASKLLRARGLDDCSIRGFSTLQDFLVLCID